MVGNVQEETTINQTTVTRSVETELIGGTINVTMETQSQETDVQSHVKLKWGTRVLEEHTIRNLTLVLKSAETESIFKTTAVMMTT